MLALPVALAASALVVGPTVALRKPIESQMTTIKTIRKNAGGKDGLFESFMDRERGPSQHCIAFDDDKDTSCALGYGHLGRLALGGYAVLASEFHLSSVYVLPDHQRKGVGAALVDELLHRLPPDHNGWAQIVSTDADAISFAQACGGFPASTRSRYTWRGHSCAFVEAGGESGGDGPPIVLLHGFAGSAYNAWRSTIPFLARRHRVYALDLLGLGASAQPADVEYSIELWREQVTDFVREQVGGAGEAPPILIGHSFGSLVALEVAAAADAPEVAAVGMMNCGAGLNNKNVVKMAERMDAPAWQVAAFDLVLSLVDVIFNQRWLLSIILERFATAENVRGALESSVYVDAARVDADLVSDYLSLAQDKEAAVEVLRQIYTNNAGPVPFDAADQLPESFPLLCIWGDDDKLGAATGPVGSYFCERARQLESSRWELIRAGHVPQDDSPQVTNAILGEWLAGL